MPVDWLKLVHEGRLTDDGIKDKNVKKAGLYVAPELTVAWLLIKGKAVLSKRRPAQEREDMVYICIGMLTWVCQQPILPELPREKRKNSHSSNENAFPHFIDCI